LLGCSQKQGRSIGDCGGDNLVGVRAEREVRGDMDDAGDIWGGGQFSGQFIELVG